MIAYWEFCQCLGLLWIGGSLATIACYMKQIVRQNER
jgi:hypothetical protein